MTSTLLLQTVVRIALSIWATITLAAGLSTEPAVSAPEPAAAAPTVVYEGLADDQERWEWAAGQFDAAGLTLENVEVRFATDPEPCKGNAGLHISGNGTHLVEFLTERGVSVWYDRDVEWHEQAAEIITWGIAEHGCWVLPRAIIGDRDLDVLAANYELLTGQTPRCDAEPSPRTPNVSAS